MGIGFVEFIEFVEWIDGDGGPQPLPPLPDGFPNTEALFYLSYSDSPANSVTTVAQDFAPTDVNTTENVLDLPTENFDFWAPGPITDAGGSVVTFTTTGTLPAPILPDTGYILSLLSPGWFQVYPIGEQTSVTFSDDFNRANEPLETSPNWFRVGGADGVASITNNQVSITATECVYQAPSPNTPDHFVQVALIDVVHTNPGAFIACRLTDSQNFVGMRYRIDAGVGKMDLYQRVLSSFTAIGTTDISLISGDICRLECRDNLATVIINGDIVIGPVAFDATLNSSNVGLVPRQMTQDPWIDNFVTGVVPQPGGLTPGALPEETRLYAQNYMQSSGPIVLQDGGSGTHTIHCRILNQLANLKNPAFPSAIQISDWNRWIELRDDSANRPYMWLRLVARDQNGSTYVIHGKRMSQGGDTFAARQFVAGARTVYHTYVCRPTNIDNHNLAKAMPDSVDTTTGIFTATGLANSQPFGATGTLRIRVRFTAVGTGLLPDPFTDGTSYWARSLSGTTFAIYPTEADAQADTNRIIPTTNPVHGDYIIWSPEKPGDLERQRDFNEQLQPDGTQNAMSPMTGPLGSTYTALSPVSDFMLSGMFGIPGRSVHGLVDASPNEVAQVNLFVPDGTTGPTRTDTGLPIETGEFWINKNPASSVQVRFYLSEEDALANVGVPNASSNHITFTAAGDGWLQVEPAGRWPFRNAAPSGMTTTTAPELFPLGELMVFTIRTDFNNPAQAEPWNTLFINGEVFTEWATTGPKGNLGAAVDDGTPAWTLFNSPQGHVPLEADMYVVAMGASVEAVLDDEIIAQHTWAINKYGLGPPPPPIVADQAVLFGALTPAGEGEFTPVNTGGEIISASITSGDPLGHWQVAPNGELTPSAAGAAADLNAGPYALNCDYNDGADSAVITITTVAGAASSLFVVQHGVTFNFLERTLVGQYANGDWWALGHEGEVVIGSIDPPGAVVDGQYADSSPYTNRVVNGAMINPGNASFVGGQTADNDFGSNQGYDSLAGSSQPLPYDESFNIDPGKTGTPIVLSEGSVVKSVYNPSPEPTGRASLNDLVVLTVVGSIPFGDAFRPPVASANKASLWREVDLDYTFLPNLTAPGSAPTLQTAADHVSRMFQVQYTNNLGSRNISPVNNHPEYGRDIGKWVEASLLSLCLDYTEAQKRDILVGAVQAGIDVYGRIVEGGIFYDLGGGNAWHKTVLVFAARALNDAALIEWSDQDQHNVFAEDRQIFAVSQTTVNTPPFTGDGQPREAYTVPMIGMPEWGEQAIRQPNRNDSRWAGIGYRQITFASSFGSILAARLVIGGESAWNYPEQFEYQDRVWNYEHDVAPGGSNNITTFAFDMWTDYRNNTDATAPVVEQVSFDGDQVWLKYNELIDIDSVPATTDFTVEDDTTPVTVTAVTIIGYSVVLTVASPIDVGSTVDVTYTPGTNPIQDVAGNDAAAFSGGTDGIDPDAQAIIDQMVPTPDAARQTSINDLVIALKSADNAWDVFDYLSVHEAHSQQAGLLNWKDPTGVLVTNINGMAFAVDAGFTGDGSSSYLDSGYEPSTFGGQFMTNSCHIGFRINTNVAGAMADIGMRASAAGNITQVNPRAGSDTAFWGMNQDGSSSITSTDSTGHWIARRSAPNAIALFRNGVLFHADTMVSDQINPGNMFIGAVNQAGAPASFSTRQIAISHAGGVLTDSQITAINAAFNAYIAGL